MEANLSRLHASFEEHPCTDADLQEIILHLTSDVSHWNNTSGTGLDAVVRRRAECALRSRLATLSFQVKSGSQRLVSPYHTQNCGTEPSPLHLLESKSVQSSSSSSLSPSEKPSLDRESRGKSAPPVRKKKSASTSREIRLLMPDIKVKSRGIRQTDDEKYNVFLSDLDSLLDRIEEQEFSDPFRRPVSKKEYPNYYEDITNPMDLQTMRKKIRKHQYSSKKDFAEDISLICSNCRAYNTIPDNPFVEAVSSLELYASCQLDQISDYSKGMDIDGNGMDDTSTTASFSNFDEESSLPDNDDEMCLWSVESRQESLLHSSAHPLDKSEVILLSNGELALNAWNPAILDRIVEKMRDIVPPGRPTSDTLFQCLLSSDAVGVDTSSSSYPPISGDSDVDDIFLSFDPKDSLPLSTTSRDVPPRDSEDIESLIHSFERELPQFTDVTFRFPITRTIAERVSVLNHVSHLRSLIYRIQRLSAAPRSTVGIRKSAISLRLPTSRYSDLPSSPYRPYSSFFTSLPTPSPEECVLSDVNSPKYVAFLGKEKRNEVLGSSWNLSAPDKENARISLIPPNLTSAPPDRCFGLDWKDFLGTDRFESDRSPSPEPQILSSESNRSPLDIIRGIDSSGDRRFLSEYIVQSVLLYEGFDGVSSQSLDVLADLFEHFIRRFGSACSSLLCDTRSSPSVPVLLPALHAFGGGDFNNILEWLQEESRERRRRLLASEQVLGELLTEQLMPDFRDFSHSQSLFYSRLIQRSPINHHDPDQLELANAQYKRQIMNQLGRRSLMGLPSHLKSAGSSEQTMLGFYPSMPLLSILPSREECKAYNYVSRPPRHISERSVALDRELKSLATMQKKGPASKSSSQSNDGNNANSMLSKSPHVMKAVAEATQAAIASVEGFELNREFASYMPSSSSSGSRGKRLKSEASDVKIEDGIDAGASRPPSTKRRKGSRPSPAPIANPSAEDSSGLPSISSSSSTPPVQTQASSQSDQPSLSTPDGATPGAKPSKRRNPKKKI